MLISTIPLLHFPKTYFYLFILLNLRQNLLAFHASLGITTISNWQSLVSWSRFLDFRGDCDQAFLFVEIQKCPPWVHYGPGIGFVQRSLTHTFRLVSGSWFLSQGLGRCRLWYKPVPGDLGMQWSNFHQMLSLSDRIEFPMYSLCENQAYRSCNIYQIYINIHIHSHIIR